MEMPSNQWPNPWQAHCPLWTLCVSASSVLGAPLVPMAEFAAASAAARMAWRRQVWRLGTRLASCVPSIGCLALLQSGRARLLVLAQTLVVVAAILRLSDLRPTLDSVAARVVDRHPSICLHHVPVGPGLEPEKGDLCVTNRRSRGLCRRLRRSLFGYHPPRCRRLNRCRGSCKNNPKISECSVASLEVGLYETSPRNHDSTHGPFLYIQSVHEIA